MKVSLKWRERERKEKDTHSVSCILEAANQDKDRDDGEQGESKFASHLKSSQAVSDFARTRSMREQREFLPVFGVREELLKVVRDNQGKN